MGIIYIEDQPEWAEAEHAQDTIIEFFPDERFQGVRNLLEFKNTLSSWAEKSERVSLFVIDIMLSSDHTLSALDIGRTAQTALGFNAGLMLVSEYLRGERDDEFGSIPIIFFSSREEVNADGDRDPVYQKLLSESPDNTRWIVKSHDGAATKLLKGVLIDFFGVPK